MGYIYRYTDLEDNTIKYIGIVWSENRTLEQRINEHAKYDDWCKNKKWKIEYLYENINTRTDAEYLEAHYISLYETDKYFNIKKAGWGVSSFIQNKDEDDWRLYNKDGIDDLKQQNETDSFDWDAFRNINNNIIVHCKTEKENFDFRRELYKHGFKSAARYNHYDVYKDSIVYNCFCSLKVENYFNKENYEILEWNDYMKNKFTKLDLKTGMIVTTENGEEYLVLLKFAKDDIRSDLDESILISLNGDIQTQSILKLSFYNEDLTVTETYLEQLERFKYLKLDNKYYDIIRVEIFKDLKDNFKKSERCIIWERDWKHEEVKKMTMKDLEEHFGCKIRIAKED